MASNLIFQHQFIPSYSSTTNNTTNSSPAFEPPQIKPSLVIMKFFLAVCLLAGVAMAKPNMSYGGSSSSSYGGSSSYGSSSNYGGEMKPAASPAMKQQSNYGQYSVTYTAPGQVYTARPISYVPPQLTFNPPAVHYNGQAVTYSQPGAEHSGPEVLNFQNSGNSYDSAPASYGGQQQSYQQSSSSSY